MLHIKKTRTTTPKQKPDQSNLGFGKYFTDHMLTIDYDPENGWHDAQIVPYGPLSLDPTAMVFHYGQEIFEGMKAYRRPDGKIQLFRPEMNGKRMANSCKRMCMAELPVDDFVQAVTELVLFDQDWIPTAPATSLYIRPFIIATDPALGVHPSHTYKFVFILSPVGAYFKNGFNTIGIFVEDEYIRAAPGGTGFAKCGGNYAGSLAGQHKAEKMGYSQVLWLDGVHHKYVAEVGAMNMMFIIDNEVITAPLDGTILPGVTRDSCLTILRDWGYKVSERDLSIGDLLAAAKSGALTEAFGCGTAAVISPVGKIGYKDECYEISGNKVGPIQTRLYEQLTGIQWGRVEDTYGWTKVID